jgi:hypothetical protein
MAVLVGLAVGAVAGLRRWNLSGRRLVVIPLCFAGLEIIVNMARFGVAAVAVWSVILVVLAALATLGARAATLRWAGSHTH